MRSKGRITIGTVVVVVAVVVVVVVTVYLRVCFEIPDIG